MQLNIIMKIDIQKKESKNKKTYNKTLKKLFKIKE